MVDDRRVRVLNDAPYTGGPVVYVMGRDFRAEDNWALLYAQELALKHQVPLCVLVHFGKNIVMTNERQHNFLMDGLEELASELSALNISFFITYGDWHQEVKQFVAAHGIGAIVTDFSPLRELRWWWHEVVAGIELPIYEVDAHNIIPAWVASDKEEYAAYTFRNKVKKLYKEFKGKIPAVKKHPYDCPTETDVAWPQTGCAAIDWKGVRKMHTFSSRVAPITWCRPGAVAAKNVLQRFIDERLSFYADKRNDPNAEVLSNLSPYIRHGFISVQYIAHEIEKIRGNTKDKAAFMDELVVRRELAENFCLYNENYDNFEGLRDWAKQSLNEHRSDEREYLYTYEEFREAKTHDPLWNAAQMELLRDGKMHGYMRMYWAKKILEWSKTPEEAIETTVLLNDHYSIDGRDPNGYAGILWSIGGVHDRPWFEREIFGKVRYMNYNGAKRKFDVDAYIAKHAGQPTLV